MIAYIGTPCSQVQATWVRDAAVLVSFAAFKPWMRDYIPSYRRLLIDSGAFSELNSGKAVDLGAYVEFAHSLPHADAWAGLDDISGDWRRSLKNYKAGGFPTIHDTDPPELLSELVSMARERGGWIGVGLLPPRTGREDWLWRTLRQIPDDLHVHGWALGRYSYLPRLDSFDSTHAWLEWAKFKKWAPWLTPSECMEIAVKKVTRRRYESASDVSGDLFAHLSKKDFNDE